LKREIAGSQKHRPAKNSFPNASTENSFGDNTLLGIPFRTLIAIL
jgi:hypothetical protein